MFRRCANACFYIGLLIVFALPQGASGAVGGSPFYEFQTPVILYDTVSTPYGDMTVGVVNKNGMGLNNAGQIAVPVHLFIGTNNVPAVLVEGPFDNTLRAEIRYGLQNGTIDAFSGYIYHSVSYNDEGTLAIHEYPSGSFAADDRVTVKSITDPYDDIGIDPFPVTSFPAVYYQYPDLSEDGHVAVHAGEWDRFLAFNFLTNWVLRSAPHTPSAPYVRPATRVDVARTGVEEDQLVHQFYPVVATGGLIAVQSGQDTNNGAIMRYPAGGGPETVASAPSEFEWFGKRVAMDESGKVLAFIGRRNDGVEGLFLKVDDPDFQNADPFPVLSTNYIIGFTSAGDPIRFSRFLTECAPRVIVQDRGGDGDWLSMAGDNGADETSILIAFMAQPSSNSVAEPVHGNPLLFTDQPGVFVARFDLHRGLGDADGRFVNFRALLPVIQEGDLIDGQPIVVDGLRMQEMGRGTRDATGAFRGTSDANPELGDHVLAIWAETPAAIYAIKAYHLDTDADGLPDHWERPGGGIDMDGDGFMELSLHDAGASHLHKDLFIELDWTSPRLSWSYPGGWNNAPTREDLESVVYDRFANAPVTNPDGLPGINVHIDAGAERSVEFDGDAAGGFHGGQMVSSEASSRPDLVIISGVDELPATTPLGLLGKTTMDYLKSQYYLNVQKGARELAFRYGVLSDYSVMQPVADEYVFEVVSASTRELLVRSLSGSYFLPSAMVDGVVMIHVSDGVTAGYVRRGVVEPLTPVPIPSPYFKVEVLDDEIGFKYAPANGDRIILGSSHGGNSEMYWFSHPTNLHRLPGNDLVVSLAGWGVRPDRGLGGDARKLGMTLTHELGHTMGLAHGGHEVEECEYDGENFWSLMSYSHSSRESPASPILVHEHDCSAELVETNFAVIDFFSSGDDPEGIDEFAYLRMAPWNTPWMVGNSYYQRDALAPVHPADEPHPSPPREAGDREGPRVGLPAPSLRAAALGSPFTLQFTAEDPSGIDTIRVKFDADGDGFISNLTERVAATNIGGAVFQAVFSNINGAATGRLLTVHAIDGAGNATTVSAQFRIGGFVSSDTFNPQIYVVDANPLYAPLGEPLELRMYVYEESTAPLGGVAFVDFILDVDGNGVTNAATEYAAGGLDLDGYWRARFVNLSGPLGDRRLRVVAEDRAGNRATNQSVIVRIIAAETTNPVIIAVSPTNGTVVPLGPSSLPVTVQASDESRLERITAGFDANGDGIATGVYEVATTSFYYGETGATSVFNMANQGVTGGEGERWVDVLAQDYQGRTATQRVSVWIVDLQPPTITISNPHIEQIVRPATNFLLTGSAIDNQSVTSLVVRIDLDGDGQFTSPGETVPVDPGDAASFSLSFGGFTGPDGLRSIRVEAADPKGQVAVLAYSVYVGPGVRIFSPAVGDTLSIGQSVFAVAEAPEASQLVFALDLNGDGDRLDTGEVVTGALRVVNLPEPYAQVNTRVSQAILGTVEGLPGPRELLISGTDSNGAPLTLTRTVSIADDAVFPAPVSRRVGGIPLLADPGWSLASLDSPYPSLLAPLGSGVVFAARTPTEGQALWFSDGTKKGTRLIADANPDVMTSGLDAGKPSGMGITRFAAFNQRVFFDASDKDAVSVILTNGTGTELWVTDGSAAGTYQLKDINPFKYPDNDSSSPGPFAVFSNRLYFGAHHNTFGRELWATDGTTTGTVMVADMTPGVLGTGPDHFVEMDGQLWFLLSRLAICRTDGTSNGTVRAIDLPPFGLSSVSVDKLTNAGHRLFFEFHDGTNGWELWSSDGTTNGAVLLSDINPGLASSFPKHLTALSNKLYFTANSAAFGTELWVTDGTSPGTRMVRDIVPGASSANPRNLIVHQGRLWFSATTTERGEELWSVDPATDTLRTEAEIASVNAVNGVNGNTAWATALPTNLVSVGDALFMQARDGVGRFGLEFHRLDSNGVSLVRDTAPAFVDRYFPSIGTIYNGPDHGYPALFTMAGGKTYFRSGDSLYGAQLHVSDGTASGTLRLGGRVRTQSIPESATWSNTPVYLAAAGTVGRWSHLSGTNLNHYPFTLPVGISSPSNLVGSAKGFAFVVQEKVPPFIYYQNVWAVSAPGHDPVRLLRLNQFWRMIPAGPGWLIAGRDTNNQDRIWVSNGTESGTRQVLSVNAAYGISPVDWLVEGTQTLFTASVNNPEELWISDGTTGGTRRVVIEGSTQTVFYARYLTRSGSRIGFFAYDHTLTNRFWTLDSPGGSAKPGPVLNVYAGYSAPDVWPVTYEGKWVFSGISPVTNLPLWITDGTVTGTFGFGMASSDSYPGGLPVQAPRRLTLLGSDIVFAAGFGFDGEELFAADLASLQTRYLGNLYRLPSAGANPGSSPRSFTRLGEWLLFAAADKNRGEELWRTDGSVDGTIFVKDLFPGVMSSDIREMANIGERVFFSARSPEGGRELWSSDGTVQGTLPVEDIVPGPGSSDPKALQSVGSNLYYFALDGSEDPSLRVIATTNLPSTPYQQWLAGFGPGAEFDGAPWEDGDGDEWSNEMEFLFDTSPVDPLERHPVDRVAVQMVVFPDTITDYFVVQYFRPVNWQALGLWFQFESANYLSQFSPIAPEPVSVQNLGDQELVTVRIYTKDLCCANSPRPDYFYVRLRVNRD